ncbi:MAG: WD40 repeat domain-containing protein [Gemmataceae bacterium]
MADPEAEAIKRLVWEAGQAGWDRGDLAAFMAVRTADFRETAARGPDPSPADVTLDRAQVEAVRRIQFRPGRNSELTWQYEDAHVTFDGNGATLRYRLVGQSSEYFNAVESVARLAKTPSGWAISAERNWPVAYKLLRERKTYDAAYWTALDRAADAATGKVRVRALYSAQRYADAYAAMKELGAGAEVRAEDWALRGEVALAVGDADAARAAFRQATELNPEVELPWYLSRSLWTHRARVVQFGVAFLPDGRLAVGSGDKSVYLYDRRGGEVAALPPLSAPVASVAADGSHVVAAALGGDNEIAVFDAADGTPARRMLGHRSEVHRVALSPDGRRAGSSSADGTARVWELGTGKELLQLRHDDRVLAAVFSPDGTRIATASHDKTARVWDATTGKQLESHTFADQLKRVAYSPDGKRLAIASVDGTVAVIDAAGRAEWKAHKGVVEVVLFSPDGKLLATAGDSGTIRLWDMTTRKKRAVLSGLRGTVFSLAFDRDGTRLASAAGDGTARVWDVTGVADGN